MYRKSKEEVLALFNVKENEGLNNEQIRESSFKYGKNILEGKGEESLFILIIKQLKEALIILLIIAAIISFLLQEYLDSAVIMIVVVINVTFGVMQESKAKKAIEALEKMASYKANVLRNKTFKTIDMSEIVKGDIVYLEAGDYVPCDLRLLTTSGLEINESTLSGEAIPVLKDGNVVYNEKTELADQRNMAFMSTFVTKGKGSGICINVGMDSEIGKIMALLDKHQAMLTPLQLKLNKLGKFIGFLCVLICLFILLLGIYQKRSFIDMVLIALSLAVGAIPEGLGAVVTIVLSIGMLNLSKKNAIVRHLPSVETLGCVSIICSDKTGTITKNEMEVIESFADLTSDHYNKLLVHGMVLCNDVSENETGLVGEGSELALVKWGKSLNIERFTLLLKCPELYQIPFDSDKKWMASVHTYGDDKVVFIKGALEIILNKCKYIVIDAKIKEMSKKDLLIINNAFNESLAKGQRVLGLAYKKVNSFNDLDKDLIFVGYVGLQDSEKKEVKAVIEECKRANIIPIMITGDHPSTALYIASRVGIAANMKQVIKGSELDALSDEELRQNIMKYRVFARVSPYHKVRLVEAYQSLNHVVAMSGDGVNDALSLQKADIGIAMGIRGTDVAKSASDMILMDDNFATIVVAVKEGRKLYLNIQKSVLFLLSCNIGEVITILLSIIFLNTLPSPLTPIQLLWINLITDTFPSLALGVEDGDDDLMNKKPRDKDESIFGKNGISHILFNGLYIGTITLVAYRYGLTYSLETGRTLAFFVLSVSQLFHALNHHDLENSILNKTLLNNHMLILTVVISIVVQVLTFTISPLQKILKTTMLSFNQFVVALLLAVSVIIVNEIKKKILE